MDPQSKEAGIIEFGEKVTSMFSLMKTDIKVLILVAQEEEEEYGKKLEELTEPPWQVDWDLLLKTILPTDTQMQDALGHYRKYCTLYIYINFRNASLREKAVNSISQGPDI